MAKFFAFLSQPRCRWNGTEHRLRADHVRRLRDDAKSGYYDKIPGADIAVKQLTYKPPTANSKGLRFGNFVQGREVIEEEMEAVFAGKKDAKAAMDDAVKRGNEILRKFEAANKSSRSEEPAPARLRLVTHGKARRLPLDVAAVRAGRAADRGHHRLLLLAGGAGGLVLVPGAGCRSACRPSSSGSQNFTELLKRLRTTSTRSASRRSSACWWRCRASSISLLLASMADRVVRGALAYKTLLIWPYAVAPAIAGVLWAFMFAPSIGIVTYVLKRHRHRLELDHQRRPGDAAHRDRGDLEADQLQLPLLPRRAAVDPALADRGRGDRRRRRRCGASGRSSSRCCRRPRSSCS